MQKKEFSDLDSIIDEIEGLSNSEKIAEKIYKCLREGNYKDKQKKMLFKKLEDASVEGSEWAWVYMGDCYKHGNGCQKSIKKAEECYQAVMDMDVKEKEIRQTAASRLGNIYIDKEDYNKAVAYINMSTNPKDYSKLAEFSQKKGKFMAALEEYSKAGDLGDIKAYAKATACCLKSRDETIKNKAIDFAIKYIESDAKKKYRQRLADMIMKYFYELKGKNSYIYDEQQFRRFQQTLTRNGLRLKSESKLKDMIIDGDFAKAMGLLGTVTTVFLSVGKIGEVFRKR